jgi:ribonuclease R
MDRRTTSLPEDRLRVIAEESSETERRADEAERELIEWKKARFMEDRVGEEFDALIISTTRFGFFVELEKYFVEGLVPIDTLPGDNFRFHENVRKIIGERSRREYSIGDTVRVVLDRVDALERKLTFGVVETAEKGKKRRALNAGSTSF